MRGDGNCLFRALSHPYGDFDRVRACVVDHIDDHWERYEPFVAGEDRGSYVRDMRRHGTWGDELVISAYCDVHECGVTVLDTSLRPIQHYGPTYPRKWLRYNGCHYDVYVP